MTTTNDNPKLTAAQERYLAEIRATPGRRYNGRARKPLEALRAAGLIEYDFDLRPSMSGFAERFTCRPTAQEARACTTQS